MPDSAAFGEPPHTEQDYWIVKGILLGSPLTADLNASNGVLGFGTPPLPDPHQTRRPGIIAGLSVCILIIALVTLTRLGLRWFNSQLKWGWDDVLMVPALFMALAYPSLQIAMVSYGGAGRHMYDVTYQEYYIFHWLAAVAQIDYFICMGVIKLSIAIFNMRLTSLASSKIWHFGNWTFFGITLAYIVLAFFINIFVCTPAITSFDYIAIGKSGHAPKCISLPEMNLILRVMNITLDYCLLSVPIIVISSLQLSWRKKFRIGFLFAFGALACIGSVMALVAQYRLKSDVLWNYTSLLAWAMVELVFGCITACLPTLSSLLPGTKDNTTAYGATGESSRRGNFSHHGNTMSSRQNTEAKKFSDLEDEGIVRAEEFELTFTQVSENDADALRRTHQIPFDQKGFTGYHEQMARSHENQPDSYGPLDYHRGAR